MMMRKSERSVDKGNNRELCCVSSNVNVNYQESERNTCCETKLFHGNVSFCKTFLAVSVHWLFIPTWWWLLR